MVLDLSWSCSQDCHKAGVHAEVSGTGAESRRERGDHHPGDDVNDLDMNDPININE
jgi:hypothetical protein